MTSLLPVSFADVTVGRTFSLRDKSFLTNLSIVSEEPSAFTFSTVILRTPVNSFESALSVKVTICLPPTAGANEASSTTAPLTL